MFQGNALFPSRCRSLATGCLPPVSTHFGLLAVAGEEDWSRSPGYVQGSGCGGGGLVEAHKSLNSYFSQGRRKTLKKCVGFSRSVKHWPRLSRVPDESGLPRPVPSTQLLR